MGLELIVISISYLILNKRMCYNAIERRNIKYNILYLKKGGINLLCMEQIANYCENIKVIEGG